VTEDRITTPATLYILQYIGGDLPPTVVWSTKQSTSIETHCCYLVGIPSTGDCIDVALISKYDLRYLLAVSYHLLIEFLWKNRAFSRWIYHAAVHYHHLVKNEALSLVVVEENVPIVGESLNMFQRKISLEERRMSITTKEMMSHSYDDHSCRPSGSQGSSCHFWLAFHMLVQTNPSSMMISYKRQGSLNRLTEFINCRALIRASLLPSPTRNAKFLVIFFSIYVVEYGRRLDFLLNVWSTTLCWRRVVKIWKSLLLFDVTK